MEHKEAQRVTVGQGAVGRRARRAALWILERENMMTNETDHDRDREHTDMSIAAIKKRRTDRQFAIKRLLGTAGPVQKVRNVETQDREKEHHDD